MQETLQPQTTLQNAKSLLPTIYESKDSPRTQNILDSNPVNSNEVESNSISKIQQPQLDSKKTSILPPGLSNVLSNSDLIKTDSIMGAPANDSENNSQVKFERRGSPERDNTNEPLRPSKNYGDVSLPLNFDGRSRENSIDLKQKSSFSPQLTRDLPDSDPNMVEVKLDNEDSSQNSGSKEEKRKAKEGILMKGLKKITKSISKKSDQSGKTLKEDAKLHSGDDSKPSSSRTLKSLFARKKNDAKSFSIKKINVDDAEEQKEKQEEEYNMEMMEEKVKITTPQGEGLQSKQTLKEKDSFKDKDFDTYSLEKRQLSQQLSQEMGKRLSQEMVKRFSQEMGPRFSQEMMGPRLSQEMASKPVSVEMSRQPSQEAPIRSDRSIQYTLPQNSRENLLSPKLDVHRKSRSSSRMNDRRRVSFGNNLQLEQAMIVQKAQKWPKFIKLIKYTIFFITASAISYIITIVLSSLITYPYENETKRSWIGQFFHGFLLSTLSIVLLKATIHNAIIDAEETDTTRLFNAKKFRKTYGKRDELILACFLPTISGLLMYAWYKSLFDPLITSSEFFGAEFLTVLFNIIIISLYYFIKNNSLKKKARKNQRQGFFFVPVYKDFLTDLYGVRAVLQNKSEATTPSIPESDDKKLDIKEEGIDKYKPKRAYEIVTSLKIFGSQLLLIILYLQFITLIGLINRFIDVVEKDQLGAALVILIATPFIMKIFAKILEIANKLIKLDMIVYVYYLNTAFTAMFYQQVLFHIHDMKYVWLMIGWKAAYKFIVYIALGVRIDFWKIDVIAKLKEKLATRKKRAEKKKNAPNSLNIRKSLRSDTLSMKYKDEIEKAIEAKRKHKQEIQTLFTIRFMCITFNDVLYSAVTLGLLLGYSIIDQSSIEEILGEEKTKIYIKGSWVKLALDIGMMTLVGIVWKVSKNYNFLEVGQGLSVYFQKYMIPCIFISLSLYIAFVFLVQSLSV